MKAFKAVIIYLLLVACAASTSEAQTVYITKTGKKYHRGSCQYLRQSKFAISIKDAIDRGYTACSVCKPESSVEHKPNTPVKTPDAKPPKPAQTPAQQPTQKKDEVRARQCLATTKAGTRCKRMTTNASGYCYQHQ